nr:immunoglobulin heavy chain junction region [Macaca mulatta]MOX15121.1 immunoglobulin heavy chain junction region [Macaca mulatta]MOX16138.1 immunoglobulin heavy chain junction region [Macaca mulatta]
CARLRAHLVVSAIEMGYNWFDVW